MLNDFVNGFEAFKEEYSNMSEEEFMAPFFEMGIEFVSIAETKTKVLSNMCIQRNIMFNVELERNHVQPKRKQLIA